MYKKKRGSKFEKINARWEKGIFVGIRRKSNEVMSVTPEGVEEARSVSRLPEEHRCGGDNLNWVKWTPWRRYKDAVEADGDLPEGVPAEERETEGPSQKGAVFVKTNRPVQGNSTFLRRMLKSMGVPGVAEGVQVSQGV